MSVVSRLYYRFWQFGGWLLLIEYFKLGALRSFFREGWLVLRGKEDVTEAYSKIQGDVAPHIKKKYEPFLDELIENYSKKVFPHEHSRKIWVCWLQGMELAPEVVKVCYESSKQYLKDREIVVITKNNINDYVMFPEHIQRKFEKGIIPMAQFSDLLRLELLTRYGGTWIDATVLCTGFGHSESTQNDSHTESTEKIESYFDSDLFLFQFIKKGETRFIGISNWFITASSNQKVLLILRDMLYQYWKDYNCLVAYFIFHIFFTMIAEKMPDEIQKIPRKNNKYCFYLEHRLSDTFDATWMKELMKRCCFHKLNVRLWNEAERIENTFRSYLKIKYKNAE